MLIPIFVLNLLPTPCRYDEKKVFLRGLSYLLACLQELLPVRNFSISEIIPLMMDCRNRRSIASMRTAAVTCGLEHPAADFVVLTEKSSRPMKKKTACADRSFPPYQKTRTITLLSGIKTEPFVPITGRIFRHLMKEQKKGILLAPLNSSSLTMIRILSSAKTITFFPVPESNSNNYRSKMIH